MDAAARIAACRLPDLSETWKQESDPLAALPPPPPVWPFLAVVWVGTLALGLLLLTT